MELAAFQVIRKPWSVWQPRSYPSSCSCCLGAYTFLPSRILLSAHKRHAVDQRVVFAPSTRCSGITMCEGRGVIASQDSGSVPMARYPLQAAAYDFCICHHLRAPSYRSSRPSSRDQSTKISPPRLIRNMHTYIALSGCLEWLGRRLNSSVHQKQVLLMQTQL